MAKYLTLSGLQTFYKGIKTKLDGKVDVKEGYGLSKNDLTDELKAQYDAAVAFTTSSDAEKNVIVGVKVNGEAASIAEDRTIDITVPTGALADKDKVAEADLATELATKISGKVDAQEGYSLVADTDIAKIATNETAIAKLNGDSSTEGSVDYKISKAVASTYQVQGAKTFAELATATQTVGYVYNVTDAFTTDTTFVEGAGKAYPAGTNVVWTATGWDCLAGTYDLTGFATSESVASDISDAKAAVVGASGDAKTADTVNGAKAFATDAADAAKTSVVGTDEDTKDTDTVKGAKAFATDAVSTAKTDIVGQDGDSAETNTIYGVKAYAKAVAAGIEAITDEEIDEILQS